MNCPKCGRFMGLYIWDDVGKDIEQSVFWWNCNNNDCYMIKSEFAIVAPEYDWLYWYKDIPKKDLRAHPELKVEYDQAKEKYLNRNNRRVTT